MTLRLHYFDGRGLAEGIRFVLGALGLAWQDVHLTTRADMLALIDGKKLMFNQLPLLETPDGLHVVQSGAILRHLARVHGIDGAGAGAEAAVRCDMLVCGAVDFASAYVAFPFHVAGGQDPAVLREALRTGPAAKYLPRFEEQLAGASPDAPFLLGAKLLLCDAVLLSAIETAVEHDAGALAAYPRLAAWRDAVRAQPNVAAFLASPHRHPPADGWLVALLHVITHECSSPGSFTIRTAKYVAAVNTVLGRS
jgi:glutathione S-transferase